MKKVLSIIGLLLIVTLVNSYNYSDTWTGKKSWAYENKQKCQPKAQHEFTIKGIKIMASSKKDAIKKFNHRKK